MRNPRATEWPLYARYQETPANRYRMYKWADLERVNQQVEPAVVQPAAPKPLDVPADNLSMAPANRRPRHLR